MTTLERGVKLTWEWAIGLLPDWLEPIVGWVAEFFFGGHPMTTLERGVSTTLKFVEGLMPDWLKLIIDSVMSFLFNPYGTMDKAINITINFLAGTGWDFVKKVLGWEDAAPKIADYNLPAPFTSINPTTGETRSNTNTFNFYGLQPEGLEQSVKNILRAYGMGWIL